MMIIRRRVIGYCHLLVEGIKEWISDSYVYSVANYHQYDTHLLWNGGSKVFDVNSSNFDLAIDKIGGVVSEFGNSGCEKTDVRNFDLYTLGFLGYIIF